MRNVLCQAARADRNPAIRLKALEALDGAGGDPDVLQAMLAALAADDNSGVRVQAVNSLLVALADANLLAPSLDTEAMNILRDRMQNDPNHYVRQQSATVLERLASLGADVTNDQSLSAPRP